MHFRRRELGGDGAHLFVDVVLPQSLREGRKLALDVERLLTRQAGRSQLDVDWAMPGAAWGDTPRWVPGEDEPHGNVVLAQGVSALQGLTGRSRHAVASAG